MIKRFGNRSTFSGHPDVFCIYGVVSVKQLLALCLVVAAVSADEPVARNDPAYLRYLLSQPVLYRTEIRDESNQFSAR